MKQKADGNDLHWLRFSRGEWGMVVAAVLVLGGMFFYNIEVAKGKARDWERKEQAKRVFNTLDVGYRMEVGGFPPHSDRYEIRGCGDAVCPLSEGEGTACQWGSDKPAIHLACGELDFMRLASVPDNPNTKAGDALKYKNLGTDAVVEVCLERADDPEAISMERSKIGWTREECPSGMVLIWPEKHRG